MQTKTVPLNCPACGKQTKGLPMSIVQSVDGKYQKLWCCGCHYLVHVKVG